MILDKLIEGRAYWVKTPLEIDLFFAILRNVPEYGYWWERIDQPSERLNNENQKWLLIPTDKELIAQRKAMDLLKAQKDLPPEVNEIVNKKFWELMEGT